MDLYGYGPAFKAISLAYLCFVVAVYKLNVPIPFFVLYAIGSAAFLTHLLAIKEKNEAVVDAGVYEQIFNIVVCIAIVVFVKMKH